MINEQINQLREFAKWVRAHIAKAANVEIDFWFHTGSDEESTEYRVWVEGIFNKSSKDLDYLVGMIPKFKQLCELNMEVSA